MTEPMTSKQILASWRARDRKDPETIAVEFGEVVLGDLRMNFATGELVDHPFYCRSCMGPATGGHRHKFIRPGEYDPTPIYDAEAS